MWTVHIMIRQVHQNTNFPDTRKTIEGTYGHIFWEDADTSYGTEPNQQGTNDGSRLNLFCSFMYPLYKKLKKSRLLE